SFSQVGSDSCSLRTLRVGSVLVPYFVRSWFHGTAIKKTVAPPVHPTCRRRRGASDELIEEVLLRLPPDIPASIARAGLVRKHRRRLLSDPDFPRRFPEFHRRSPPARLPLQQPPPAMTPRDSHHGRVLLIDGFDYVVRVPIADEWSSRASAACDHLDCHRKPFVVVVMGTSCTTLGTGTTYSYVNSSAAGTWGKPVYSPHSDHAIGGRPRSTLVGDALYFIILKYDLGTGQCTLLSYLESETQPFIKLFGPIELTATVDGRLGFVRVEKSGLCVWSMEEAEGARWARVGSAEGVGVIFVTVEDQLFTVNLRSGKATKVYEHRCLSNAMVVPCMSFFIPSNDPSQES
ncbi:hypothetical protein U9M48_004851, partial [Paspalum notatum var. saurae]